MSASPSHPDCLVNSHLAKTAAGQCLPGGLVAAQCEVMLGLPGYPRGYANRAAARHGAAQRR